MRTKGAHRNRPMDRAHHRPGAATTALCNRLAFQDRRGARAAARAMPKRPRQHAREHACTNGCGLWHVDYLPELVIQGVVTAAEWYGTDGRQPLGKILTRLLDDMNWHTRGGAATFERRVGGDGIDLWGAIIDVRGRMFIARDYDSPADATAAVLTEYRAALTEEAAAA